MPEEIRRALTSVYEFQRRFLDVEAKADPFVGRPFDWTMLPSKFNMNGPSVEILLRTEGVRTYQATVQFETHLAKETVGELCGGLVRLTGRIRSIEVKRVKEKDKTVPHIMVRVEKGFFTVGTGPGARRDLKTGRPLEFPTDWGKLKEVQFFGMSIKANNVVYVIDSSGSMIDTFDAVRREIKQSVSKLSGKQCFHVIFYSEAEDEPREFEPKKLVPATKDYKKKLTNYMRGIIPCEQSDPVTALKRAFEVTSEAKRKGSVVFLLADGLFPDNGKVLETVNKSNKNREVRICTCMYGNKPPEAVEVMRRIAKENKGKYTFVESKF
jgi:hypothetical protein